MVSFTLRLYTEKQQKCMSLHVCIDNERKFGAMTYEYKNRGVCSISTTVTLNDNKEIEDLKVVGGCNGNLKGIMSLVKGMRAEDAIARLEGITCGSRTTSCPDQIAKALKEALAQ